MVSHQMVTYPPFEVKTNVDTRCAVQCSAAQNNT